MLPIMNFHKIDQSIPESKTNIHPRSLRNIFRNLKELGYKFENLRSVLDNLPYYINNDEKYACISFDDGFSCFLKYALPIIEDFEIPVTLFYTTGFHNEVTENNMLISPFELRLLCKSNLVDIQSHGHDHVNYKNSKEEHFQSLVTSRYIIENIVGEKLSIYAYPYHGTFSGSSFDVVRAGYKYAVAGFGRFLTCYESPLLIPRIPIYPEDALGTLPEKLENHKLLTEKYLINNS